MSDETIMRREAERVARAGSLGKPHDVLFALKIYSPNWGKSVCAPLPRHDSALAFTRGWASPGDAHDDH
jgi:hypothetical protein